jgi:hypothetical protein
LLIELLEVFSIIGDLSDHFDTLLSDILLNDLKDLIVLQELSGNVEGEIFRIYNSLNETQPFRNQLITVIHNEYSSNVEFDIVLLLLGFEEIERCSLGDEEDAFEFESSFN